MKREGLYTRGHPQHDGTYDFIKSLGGNPYSIAQKAGLNDTPSKAFINYMPWENLCNFFEISAKDLNEADFGLKWAHHIPEDLRNTGPTLFLASKASNIRHLIAMLLDYLSIHTNGVTFAMEENLDAGSVTGVFTIHPHSPPCRQYCEHILAMVTVMGRRHIPNFKIDAVSFQYSEPDDLTWYTKLFQCPVQFNADRNTITADRTYLGDGEMNTIIKLITPILKTYLNWRVAKHPYGSKSITQLVTEVLPSIIGTQNSDIQSVAASLQFHPKKLQRLLADEGTNYSDVLNETRRNIAERLLGETDISIQRIAKMLDYTNDRALTAAAKRWFEMTPSKYRNFIRRQSSRRK